MLSAEEAAAIYQQLTGQGFRVWVTGGWGIDALLGEQTRAHKDLDLIVLLDEIYRLRRFLEGEGYRLKELWEENLRAVDAHGIEMDTAFVLRNDLGSELDLHALRLDAQGNGIPAWQADEGFSFTAQDLVGQGMIAGSPVRCLSAAMQVTCHTGYALPEYQRQDLERLHERFGVTVHQQGMKGARKMDDKPTQLPVKGSLELVYALSLLTAALMAAASIAGLVFRSRLYPSEELLQTFVANDVVNLVAGAPTLLVSLWLARKGRLLGLLLLPGALFFVLYNYIAYVFALPLSWAFLLHLLLVVLSTYTLAGLLAGIDGQVVKERLAGAVPEKFAGGVLAALGALFFLRVLGVIAGALSGGAALKETELAVNLADALITPAWVISGVLLWRRSEFGYVSGLGLLFQGSMLFIALIVFLLLQPLLTSAPFAAGDVLVIAAMGLVCFAPFALFARGVAKRDS